MVKERIDYTAAAVEAAKSLLIYFILQNYPGGIDAVVQAFKPHIRLVLVKEGFFRYTLDLEASTFLNNSRMAGARSDCGLVMFSEAP